MIIVGYQGIGKSSLASTNVNFIDLESTNFTYTHSDGSVRRDPEWYVPYCHIAEHLSAQGYDVFVSSHSEVRKALAHSTEYVLAIYPGMHLKDEWISKLQNRYNNTHLEKDLKALENAKARYDENIQEIKKDTEHSIEIQSIRYRLQSLINNYKWRNHIPVKEVLYDERGMARYQRI